MSDQPLKELRPAGYRDEQKKIRASRKQDQHQEVIKLCEALLSQGARTVELAHYYADALTRIGNPKKAIENLEPWAGQMPCFTVALYGELLHHRGRHDEAEEQFASLVAREDLSASALQRAVAYFVARDQPERALSLAQKHGAGQELLDGATGQSNTIAPAEAVGSLREKLKEAPGDAAIARQLALALREQGQFEEAITLLEKQLRANLESREARADYFATCRLADQKERAKAFVEDQTELHPELGSLWAAFRAGFQDNKARPRAKGKAKSKTKSRSKPSTEARRKRVKGRSRKS